MSQADSRPLRGLTFGLLVLLLPGCSRVGHDPTIIAGNARFEFLTPALVRLEYAPSGHFIDAPTAVVQKRDWPKVTVDTTQTDGWLTARCT